MTVKRQFCDSCSPYQTEDCHWAKPLIHQQIGWSVALEDLVDYRQAAGRAGAVDHRDDGATGLTGSSERSKNSGATSYSVLLTQESNVPFAGSLGANVEGP